MFSHALSPVPGFRAQDSGSRKRLDSMISSGAAQRVDSDRLPHAADGNASLGMEIKVFVIGGGVPDCLRKDNGQRFGLAAMARSQIDSIYDLRVIEVFGRPNLADDDLARM